MRSSFRGKLVISITALSVLMVLIVAFVSIQIANSKIIQMARLQSENNAQNAASAIDTYYEKTDQCAVRILQLPDLQEVASEPSPPDLVHHNVLLMKFLNAIALAGENGISPEITGLYLKNGDQYLLNNHNHFEFNSYRECIDYLNTERVNLYDGYTPRFFRLCRVYDNTTGQAKNSLVFFRFLYERTTMKKIGILAIAIDNDSLCESFSYVSKNCLIMDRNGIILAGPANSRIGERYENQELILLAQKRIGTGDTVSDHHRGTYLQPEIISFYSVLGNQAFLVAPFDYYSGISKLEVFSYIKWSLLVVIVSCLVAAVSSWLLSSRLSSSLQKLTDFVKQTHAGNTGERFEPVGNDEIAYLGEKINDMLDHLEKAASERELDLKKQQLMELRLMQSQINPHLLYNTLDSVLWAIQNDNKENATELIASLSRFFRIALSRGVEKIPLRKELELIENYMQIQKLARGQMVTLVKEIPESLLSYPVIKLTLQPLIENSYLHGFSGYRDDGTIRIHAELAGHVITLSVKDNGIGMLPEEVNALNERLLQNTISEKVHSVGIYNVNRRIRHEYGDDYGVTVRSEVSEYTEVTVKMPFQPELTEE